MNFDVIGFSIGIVCASVAAFFVINKSNIIIDKNTTKIDSLNKNTLKNLKNECNSNNTDEIISNILNSENTPLVKAFKNTPNINIKKNTILHKKSKNTFHIKYEKVRNAKVKDNEKINRE
ncbi:hypothetical protein [Methanocaldococcus sp.]